MQIITLEQHQVLAFVHACNRHGYAPTAEEIVNWLTSPAPLEAQYEKRKRQALSSLAFGGDASKRIMQNLSFPAFDALTQAAMKSIDMDALAQFARQISGDALTHETVEVSPGETPVDHLVRIGWLTEIPRGESFSGLRVSDLGRALLADAEEGDAADEDDQVVVLGADDPLAYPTLIGQLSESGSGLLVDPYLQVDQLHHVVGRTEVDRILVSGKSHWKGDRTKMAIYLESVKERSVEVRSSINLHDRYLVPDAGPLLMLGASLNGVGRNTTVLTVLPDAAAEAIKRECQRLWEDSEPVATSTLMDVEDPQDGQ